MAPSILPRTAIGKIFDSADSALIVFDGMSRLIYLSPWLCQRLGHPAAELLGRIGTFGGSHPVESPQFAVDRLAPPPAVFDGVSVTLTTDLKNTIGQAATEVPVVIDYHPLKGPSGELQGVLGIGSAWDEGSREGRSRFPSSDDLHRKLLVLRSQWQEAYSLEDVLVGESPEAVRLRRQVRLASTCRENILLTGPAGCGKERVARAIHFAGTESAGASLIPLDCALLDAELLQTTVTAFLRRCAALETATVPTLLLLDIDRLDEPGQGELLGMLAIHELEIRTIATARHEFVDSNAGDHFRSDLAAILSTLWISFPAVQDRPSDIPFMAQYCVEQCNIVP